MKSKTLELLGLDGSSWLEWSTQTHNITATMDSSLRVDSDNPVMIRTCLPRFLSHPSQEVRLETARLILESPDFDPNLFVSRTLDKVLQDLFQTCSYEDLKGAEKLSRMKTAVVLCCSLVSLNPCYTRLCVSSIICLLRKHQVVLNLEPVIQLVSTYAGFNSNNKADLSSVLPGILFDFLEQSFSFLEFPISLLGFMDSEINKFLVEYEAVVVPVILLNSPTAATLQDLSERVQTDAKQLVARNLSKLFQYSYPGMAATEYKITFKLSGKMNQLGDLIHQNLEKEFIRCIINDIPSLIASSFARIREEKKLGELFDLKYISSLDTEPPELNTKVAEAVIDLITLTINRDAYDFLCEQQPQSILMVAVDLCSGLQHRDKQFLLRSLYSLYCWFKHFFGSPTQLKHTVLPFLTRFLSQQLLKFAKEQGDIDCQRAALMLLEKFLQEVMVSSVESIQSFGVELNTCLVSVIANSKQEAANVAKTILEHLFVENVKKFEGIMEDLEEYPEAKEFSLLSASVSKYRRNLDLKSFFRSFLSISEKVDQSYCENILTQLQQRLGSSMFEFSVLLDQDLTLVRTVVMKLLNMSKHDLDPINQLAMKCLGLIGPIDLKTQALNLESVQPGSTVVNPASGYIFPILTELNKMLNHISGSLSMEVFKTICSMLTNTAEGREIDLKQEGSELRILEPLKTKAKKNLKTSPVIENEEKFKLDIDDSGLWVYSTSDYETWLKTLVHKLLSCMSDRSVLGLMKVVCNHSLRLCEIVLPFIIHECLLHCNGDIRLIVSSRINSFFLELFEYSTPESESRGGTPVMYQTDAPVYMDKLKVSALVKVVSYIRLQELPTHAVVDKNIKDWERNFWIAGLDYLHVSKAALYCSSYSSALLFAEIWCHQQDVDRLSNPKEMWRPLLSENHVQCHNKMNELRTIVCLASSKISDLDTCEGIKTVLAGSQEIEKKLENLPILDILAANSSMEKANLIQGLYENGMFHLLSQYLNSLPHKDLDRDMTDIQAECSWRLGEWDKVYYAEEENSFNVSIFGCVQSSLSDDKEGIAEWQKLASSKVSKDLKFANLESSTEVYSILTRLKQVGEITSLCQEISPENLEGTVEGLMKKDELCYDDFSRMEPVYSTRMSILNSLHRKRRNDEKLVQNTSLELSRRARESGVFWFCDKILENIKSPLLEFKFEQARVEWSRGKHCQAILQAKSLQQNIEGGSHLGFEAEKILPELLVSLGHWTNHQKSESSSSIITNYFSRAVELLQKDPHCDEKALVRAHLGLANLSDTHYRKAEEYMESAEYKERKESIEMRKREANILKDYSGNKDRGLRQAITVKTRFLDMDEAEIDRCLKERENYLHISIGNYLAVIQHGDQSVAVYRMLSLWFANQDNVSVNILVSKVLPKIPTYRLVPLLYQMAARMSETKGKKETDFPVILYNCIKRCAQDHPHHALPIIFALKNASLDEMIEKKTKRENLKEDERSKVAGQMVKELSKVPGFEKMIVKYSDLSVGMIEIAYLPIDKKDAKGTIGIPSTQRYTKVQKWDDIPVPTDNIPVRADRDYSCYPGIEKFEPSFTLVGGINAPKKTECLGTDGIRRPQMIKGMDDLRQDAVMQQVFSLTNQLLDQDRETRKYNLRIRTYKIVPLSQRSGILEWCSDTQPIGTILVGENRKSGVHSRYFPKKLNNSECYLAYNTKKFSPDPEKNFETICQMFPPAMKYFLMEQFPTPEEYYLGKSCFTKSAATSSMVGHILGLGDRHNNNILLDMKTAELVHIDFGIAFDKGKILPTPELVPFRLTRDIVDGFGPSGVEGVFRLVL